MNITNYVDQLAEDIENLLQYTPPCELYEEKEDVIEACMEFEDHVLNDVGAWVAEYSGISQEQLPEAELMDDAQISLLTSALMNLLNHYSFHPVFPDELPDMEKYIILRLHWQKFKAPTARYDSYYEFCSYDKDNCPFPGYCTACMEHMDEPLPDTENIVSEE